MSVLKLLISTNFSKAGVRGSGTTSGGYDDDDDGDDDIESAVSDSDSVGYCMLVKSRSAALRESKHRCRNLS